MLSDKHRRIVVSSSVCEDLLKEVVTGEENRVLNVVAYAHHCKSPVRRRTSPEPSQANMWDKGSVADASLTIPGQ